MYKVVLILYALPLIYTEEVVVAPGDYDIEYNNEYFDIDSANVKTIYPDICQINLAYQVFDLNHFNERI